MNDSRKYATRRTFQGATTLLLAILCFFASPVLASEEGGIVNDNLRFLRANLPFARLCETISDVGPGRTTVWTTRVVFDPRTGRIIDVGERISAEAQAGLRSGRYQTGAIVENLTTGTIEVRLPPELKPGPAMRIAESISRLSQTEAAAGTNLKPTVTAKWTFSFSGRKLFARVCACPAAQAFFVVGIHSGLKIAKEQCEDYLARTIPRTDPEIQQQILNELLKQIQGKNAEKAVAEAKKRMDDFLFAAGITDDCAAWAKKKQIFQDLQQSYESLYAECVDKNPHADTEGWYVYVKDNCCICDRREWYNPDSLWKSARACGDPHTYTQVYNAVMAACPSHDSEFLSRMSESCRINGAVEGRTFYRYSNCRSTQCERKVVKNPPNDPNCPGPDYAIKDEMCQRSCGGVGGNICVKNRNPDAASPCDGKAKLFSYDCDECCYVGPDPVPPKSCENGWELAKNRCLPSCGAAGGNRCGNHGTKKQPGNFEAVRLACAPYRPIDSHDCQVCCHVPEEKATSSVTATSNRGVVQNSGNEGQPITFAPTDKTTDERTNQTEKADLLGATASNENTIQGDSRQVEASEVFRQTEKQFIDEGTTSTLSYDEKTVDDSFDLPLPRLGMVVRHLETNATLLDPCAQQASQLLTLCLDASKNSDAAIDCGVEAYMMYERCNAENLTDANASNQPSGLKD